MALANAPSKAVADQCQAVKTRNRSYSRVLTWFAGRWRNHQPKRAEKPHSKSSAARRWTALLRGRRLRLPWRIASGSRQPSRDVRLMSARERERGELPSPDLSLLGRKAGQGLIVSPRSFLPAPIHHGCGRDSLAPMGGRYSPAGDRRHQSPVCLRSSRFVKRYW